MPIYQIFLSKKGVIKFVDKDIDPEELWSMIQQRYRNKLEIIHVKRINRKGSTSDGKIDYIPTSTIIVTFKGQLVPTQVVIEKLIYDVETYIPRIIQCLKCLRFGHVSS